MITELVLFSDAIKSRGVSTRGLPQSEYLNEGKYPVIGQGASYIEGWTNRDDLVISPSPSLVLYGGHTRRAKYVDQPFVPGPNVKILEAKDKTQIDHKYLFYFLSGLQIKSRGYADHFSEVKQCSIPIQTLDDQKRIARLLDKVDDLIVRRKQYLQKHDELLKSLFLEMFGDSVRNENGWIKKPFEKLLKNIESGKSPKCEAREADENEWGVLKLGAVTSCTFKENENKALPVQTPPNEKYEVKAGDLIFSRKNTHELVAACAYVFETRAKLLMPDLIFRFVLKDENEVNPIFLWKLLISKSQRKKIQSLAGGAAGSMPNISKANLKKVLLPVPPIEIQNQFATIVEKIETIKFLYQQSLNDLEMLYGALSQKAFKGELGLSSIPIPEHGHYINLELKDEVSVVDELEIALPVLDNYPMDSVEGRQRLLKGWFQEFLEAKANIGKSLDEFWQSIKYKGLDYASGEFLDDESGGRGFTREDYDHLKDWVFQQVRNGHLEQAYIETKNGIQLQVAET